MADTFKCPSCSEDGERSTMNLGGIALTGMFHNDYVDEDGNVHHHDPNGEGWSFQCSRGHYGYITREVPCPVGDYGTTTWTIRVKESKLRVG